MDVMRLFPTALLFYFEKLNSVVFHNVRQMYFHISIYQNIHEYKGNHYFRVCTNLKETDKEPILKGMTLQSSSSTYETKTGKPFTNAPKKYLVERVM